MRIGGAQSVNRLGISNDTTVPPPNRACSGRSLTFGASGHTRNCARTKPHPQGWASPSAARKAGLGNLFSKQRLCAGLEFNISQYLIIGEARIMAVLGDNSMKQ